MAPLLLAVALLAGPAPVQDDPSPAPAPAPARPNIVLLMSDDGGYSDLGCYGGEIRTPHLDRLARNGMRFRRCYNFARCSPTRAALLTGRYPTSVGMGDLAEWTSRTPFPGYQDRVDRDVPMLAELLQAAGYHTWMAGKWHLGGGLEEEERPYLPGARGFDRWFGVVGAQAPLFVHDPEDHKYVEDDHPARIEQPGWYATVGCMEWLQQRIQEHAAGEDARPFFAYVPFQAPHTPLQALRPLLNHYLPVYRGSLADLIEGRVRRLQEEGLFPPDTRFRVLPQGDRGRLAAHAAMTEAIDHAVGQLVGTLTQLDMLDNTLLLYLSDNGASGERGRLCNAPYFGAKCVVYEGGCLSPLIAHWPAGGIAPGSRSEVVTSVLDFVPTLLEVAGVSYPESWQDRPLAPPEGRSFLPALRGAAQDPPEWLFFDLYGQKACLQGGRWKLVRAGGYGGYETGEGLELFDLAADPAEMVNLALVHPGRVTRMVEAQDAWEARVGVEEYAKVRAAQQAREKALEEFRERRKDERRDQRRKDREDKDGSAKDDARKQDKGGDG